MSTPHFLTSNTMWSLLFTLYIFKKTKKILSIFLRKHYMWKQNTIIYDILVELNPNPIYYSLLYSFHFLCIRAISKPAIWVHTKNKSKNLENSKAWARVRNFFFKKLSIRGWARVAENDGSRRSGIRLQHPVFGGRTQQYINNNLIHPCI